MVKVVQLPYYYDLMKQGMESRFTTNAGTEDRYETSIFTLSSEDDGWWEGILGPPVRDGFRTSVLYGADGTVC